MGTDDSAWRIDAMDGPGGSAFVSWRPMDLLDAATDLDLPAYAITAPDFRPEPLSSRAIGFSATRRGFQLGVWDDGEELSFETLEAVSQFVMRVYNISAGRGGSGGAAPYPEGGGRGGGGGGGEEGGPERPRPLFHFEGEQTFGKFSQEIFSQFKLFTTYDISSPVANFKTIDWRNVVGLPKQPGGIIQLSDYALSLCLDEVISRWTPKGSESYEQWVSSLAEVLKLATWLAGFDFCSDILQKVVKQRGLPAELDHLADFPTRWWWPSSGFDDPVLILRRTPLSRHLARRFGHETSNAASLFDGLRIMLADPSVVVKTNGKDAHECLALLFLGAQVIVGMSAGRSSLALPEDFSRPYLLHGQQAWNWLAAQLPKGPFPQRVERVIRNVRIPKTTAPTVPQGTLPNLSRNRSRLQGPGAALAD
jgi:hypothetical protein